MLNQRSGTAAASLLFFPAVMRRDQKILCHYSNRISHQLERKWRSFIKIQQTTNIQLPLLSSPRVTSGISVILELFHLLLRRAYKRNARNARHISKNVLLVSFCCHRKGGIKFSPFAISKLKDFHKYINPIDRIPYSHLLFSYDSTDGARDGIEEGGSVNSVVEPSMLPFVPVAFESSIPNSERKLSVMFLSTKGQFIILLSTPLAPCVYLPKFCVHLVCPARTLSLHCSLSFETKSSHLAPSLRRCRWFVVTSSPLRMSRSDIRYPVA